MPHPLHLTVDLVLARARETLRRIDAKLPLGCMEDEMPLKRPQKQAVAIALSKKREAQRKK